MDIVPLKVAAQVAGISEIYLRKLVERKRITRYGGWWIKVSLAEVLARGRTLPRRRKRPRDAAGRFVTGPAWVTYDTTDGSVGCGAD